MLLIESYFTPKSKENSDKLYFESWGAINTQFLVTSAQAESYNGFLKIHSLNISFFSALMIIRTPNQDIRMISQGCFK